MIHTINYKNFIAGESKGDYLPDAGFSPKSYGLNLIKSKGELYFSEADTSRGGTVLTGEVIASTYDPLYLTELDNVLVDNDGAIYSFSGATLTKKKTSLHNYASGTTDVVGFKNYYFATYGGGAVNSRAGIIRLNSNLTSLDDEWWTMLEAGWAGTDNDDRYWRHPMEVVEDELFIANKNKIYYWNGTASGVAFTLPTSVNVTSLRKHPDGRTLLAFTGTKMDYSHTVRTSGKVYYCNPVIRDWTREINLGIQVEGTREFGGTIYCTWGKMFGYFNGSGLTPIRELETSTVTYSQNISNFDNILLIRDGNKIRAYGDLGAGNVWWTLIDASGNSPSGGLTHIAYKGDDTLFYSFKDTGSNSRLYETNIANTGKSGRFYTNRIFFGAEINISKIEIIHDTTNLTGTTSFNVYSRDVGGTSSKIEYIEHINVATSKTIIHCNIVADIFQLLLTLDTGVIGIKEIRIYYEST